MAEPAAESAKSVPGDGIGSVSTSVGPAFAEAVEWSLWRSAVEAMQTPDGGVSPESEREPSTESSHGRPHDAESA
jgi:hypothetical protein